MMPKPLATKPSVAIRAATTDDVPRLCAMMGKLAHDLGTSEELRASEEHWRRHGFGDAAKFTALIAESDGASVGMATYSPLYIPDAGTESLFVHHVFVEEPFRHLGLGKMLLGTIAARAVAEGRTALELGTILTTPRRRFFESAGFHIVAGYATYVLFGDALTQLATAALDLLS
jgi:GNAT superfamily N-acetyltransferase